MELMSTGKDTFSVSQRQDPVQTNRTIRIKRIITVVAVAVCLFFMSTTACPITVLVALLQLALVLPLVLLLVVMLQLAHNSRRQRG